MFSYFLCYPCFLEHKIIFKNRNQRGPNPPSNFDLIFMKILFLFSCKNNLFLLNTCNENLKYSRFLKQIFLAFETWVK